MKKLLAMLLALVMVLSVFTACSSTDDAENNEKSDKKKVTLEETVIYDEDDVVITATGLGKKEGQRVLKVTVENGTDEDFTLSCGDMVVNGIMVSAYGYIEVPAGEEVEDLIEIHVEEADIDVIATIRCREMYAYDDDYDTLFTVEEFELVTSAGEDYEQKLNDDGEVLFDEDDLTIIAGEVENESYGKSVVLLIKNDRDGDVSFDIEELYINDCEMDCYTYVGIYSETARYVRVSLYDSDLEDNDISKVETVRFEASFWDRDEYETIYTDEIEYTVD